MIQNDPATLAEVTDAFERYERALGDNDFAVLDELFWDSGATVRYGVGENLYGFEAILHFRRERPGGSPPRKLRNTVITTFGETFATTCTEFVREGSTRVGRQTQSWVKTTNGWRVVAAHVSLMGDSH